MGFSIQHLIVVLAIVIVIFGTKRLRQLGGDLGGAIKGFRSAMKEVDEIKTEANQDQTIDVEVTSKNKENP